MYCPVFAFSHGNITNVAVAFGTKHFVVLVLVASIVVVVATITGMFRMDLYAFFLDYNGGVQMVENNNFLNSFHVIRYLALRVTPIFSNKTHALNT
jgi:hypothetical protein